jgi:hypothetical protein
MDELLAAVCGVVLWSVLLYGGYRLFKTFVKGFIAGLQPPSSIAKPSAQTCSWCGAPQSGSIVCTVCGSSPKREGR